MKRLLGCLGLLGSGGIALAFSGAWPDLPSSGFIVGRTATIGDVKAGNAAFAAIGKNGEHLSKPVSMDIPQYALHIEGNKQAPVIVIQAEDTPAGKTIGYKLITGPGLGVCPLAEMRLLGTKKPP
jgi:hypothetical protein